MKRITKADVLMEAEQLAESSVAKAFTRVAVDFRGNLLLDKIIDDVAKILASLDIMDTDAGWVRERAGYLVGVQVGLRLRDGGVR